MDYKILFIAMHYHCYQFLIIYSHIFNQKKQQFSIHFHCVFQSHKYIKFKMDKWKNSVAVVTGGNSGIGLAILKKLAQNGIRVVGFDIKVDAIEKLKVEMKNAKIYSWLCDVTKDDITEASFKWVEKNIGSVDILINSAGLHKNIGCLDPQKSMAEIVNHIDVNYTAVIRCTRLAFKSMETRDAYGYVVNINCVYGHYVFPTKDAQLGVYGGTKFAVKATSDVMRFELNRLKNRKVRITNLSPGVCDRKRSEEIDNSSFINPAIKPEHVADTVVYILTTPHEVCITDLQIRATGSDL